MWAGFYADGASAAMRVTVHVGKSWKKYASVIAMMVLPVSLR